MNKIREIRSYLKLARPYLQARKFYQRYPHLTRDIASHPDIDVRLDVYSPDADGKDYPVLIFVHGGGWSMASKELFALAAMKLLPDKMVVVVPDHTKYPHARYEQMTGEIAAALNWTLDNIEAYGGDPGRVTIAGHSSGGHLVGLAVMDPRFLDVHGHRPEDVHGMIFASTGCDVQAQYAYEEAKGGPDGTDLMRTIEGVMGGKENFGVASPLNHMRPGLPANLILHGDADQTVPVDQAAEFNEAFEKAGVPSKLKVYPGRGHSEILFAALGEERPQIVADISDFVRNGR